MFTLGALIVFIIVAIKYTSDLKPYKENILEKEADENLFDIYIVGLWIYFIPQLLAFILPFVYKISTIPLLAAFYLPSIIIGIKIKNQLERGHDFIRQLSKKVDQTVVTGYAGIAIVTINWLLIYLMMNNKN
jgi:hypothetical protein